MQQSTLIKPINILIHIDLLHSEVESISLIHLTGKSVAQLTQVPECSVAGPWKEPEVTCSEGLIQIRIFWSTLATCRTTEP